MGRGIRSVVAATIAVALLVAATTANAKTFDCGTIDGENKQCVATLGPNDKFTLNCSDASDKYSPTKLGVEPTEVCEAENKWTKADTLCPDDRVRREGDVEGLKFKNVSHVVTIENLNYTASTERILNGSCQNEGKTKSAFFNVTVKNSSTSGFSPMSTGLCFVLTVLAFGSLTFSS